jgi:cytochrome c peroxidase
VLRHWELKPPSHPNAPLAERLLVYSTSRIVANPTTESSVMKNMSDLGLEDSGGRHRRLATPKDNPMTAKKVSLGGKLYFDKRLSTDRTVSYSACHDPATALPRQQHGRRRHGVEKRPRNAPTVPNSMFNERSVYNVSAQGRRRWNSANIENT